MVTFIFNLWSNIWPKMLIFRDMAKKLIFWESRHKILTIFVNLGQEGPRNFSDTAKCSQWPHLYTTYEATYHLKCLFLEILPKNWFFVCFGTKFLRFLVVGAFVMDQEDPKNSSNARKVYRWLYLFMNHEAKYANHSILFGHPDWNYGAYMLINRIR